MATTSKGAKNIEKTVEVSDKTRKTDMWFPRFSQLFADFPKNIRYEYGDIRRLANSIKASKVKIPLKGYKKDGKYHVTDGFRRYLALEMLFKEDGIDREAPFVPEEKGYNDKQRLLDMFTFGHTSKSLTSLEKAHGVKRAMEEHNMSEADIAKALGESAAYINRLNELNSAPAEIITLIEKNIISGAFAIDRIVAKDADQFLELFKSGAFNETLQQRGVLGPSDEEELHPLEAIKNNATNGTKGKEDKVRKAAAITTKDYNRTKEDKKGADPVVSSWNLVKTHVTKLEGKLKDPFSQKLLLFLGAIMDNKITNSDQLKKWLK